MVRALSLMFILFLSVGSHAFDVEAFKNGMSKQGGVYNDFTSQKEITILFTEGRVSESNKRLKALIPDSKKTIYDYFILGNMLFQSDFDASYKLMLEAEKKEPENPYVMFERGIHEHRLGNYSLALAYYEKFRESNIFNDNPIVSAYMTHAYLLTDQAEKAFSSWEEADFGRNHTSIEKAMYPIFSDQNQEKRRELLISEIKAGEKLKLCDLYQLDSEWEIDWWNYRPKKEYLKYDVDLASEILENDSLNEKYFSLCSSNENIDDQAYVERLREIGLFKKNARLPESSTLIYEVLKKLISSKSMKPAEFLERYEGQLVKFTKRHPADRKYFDVLAFLYANVGDQEKLKEIDRYGWKELKIEKYALSFLAGIEPQSAEFKTFLLEALKDFPLNASLNQYRLAIEVKNKEEALLKFVASQFANVKNNWSGPYRLNDYMASLRYELDRLEK
ncbi:tetratricopeptide repeat protein [Pleionea sediminis]|uniref:tetratricopeptide repeat protein n=1 Tax=Pleionea sediminis TaxID=2569479 RepID=UPI0011856E11|nr:hypothetical protein [Pleionea sediminis]